MARDEECIWLPKNVVAKLKEAQGEKAQEELANPEGTEGGKPRRGVRNNIPEHSEEKVMTSKELIKKIESNIWDDGKEVFKAIKDVLASKWSWSRNPECKYIVVRIDMRDGGCLLKDRKGNRIGIEDLVYQYER